jgi:ParB family chromosome partitioning protein
VALGAGVRRRTTRRPTSTAPELAEVEARLGERLDTRVRVRSGATKGSITIEFASPDDLARIVALIAPGQAAVGG